MRKWIFATSKDWRVFQQIYELNMQVELSEPPEPLVTPSLGCDFNRKKGGEQERKR